MKIAKEKYIFSKLKTQTPSLIGNETHYVRAYYTKTCHYDMNDMIITILGLLIIIYLYQLRLQLDMNIYIL